MLRDFLKKFQICGNLTNIMPIYSAGFTICFCATNKLYHILVLISMKKRTDETCALIVIIPPGTVEQVCMVIMALKI